MSADEKFLTMARCVVLVIQEEIECERYEENVKTFLEFLDSLEDYETTDEVMKEWEASCSIREVWAAQNEVGEGTFEKVAN